MSKILSTTARMAVYRAKQAALQPAWYILGTGGRDPSNPNPFTYKDGVGWGSDCVWFVDWCRGLDRYQPGVFSQYDGWINTDSILLEARGKSEFFEIVDQPRPGDAIVTPSLFNAKGQRTVIGHIGLIVGVDIDTSSWTSHLWIRPANERANFMRHCSVIDCNASAARRLNKHAIDYTDASRLWNRPDARWVRYKKLAPDTVESILANGKQIA